ncbi:MAG: fumarylacetoacetase [Cyclobacteriaceae bacterium]
MSKANNPNLKSWLEIPPDSDFPIQNIPFGIFKTRYLSAVAGAAIGNYVLDLVSLHENGFFDSLDLPQGIFNQRYLNSFIALGRVKTGAVRERISELLQHDNKDLQNNIAAREMALISMSEVEMLMPIQVPNYTDFYSSEDHARNVGSLFRDPDNALFPNWKHLPVGYHGRASSIVVSGTPIHRPRGQVKPPDAEVPKFTPSQKLDFELEMAFITCTNTEMGTSIPVGDAEENIFGLVLFNDWSARDIQQWEYVPLGPFLGKNFGSTISPWIVTMDALETFRVDSPKQEPEVLAYLQSKGKKSFDVALEVALKVNDNEYPVANSNFKYLYWNMSQQLAHHTVNGCNVQVGDMYASGTISGPQQGEYGSMLEITKSGKNPMKLAEGLERRFVEDYDTVIIRGKCEKDGVRIGFGECTGQILPAKQ